MQSGTAETIETATPIAIVQSVAQPWPWLELGIVGFLVLGAYWTTFVKLIAQYNHDPNFSHGYIVPFFSAFVVWLKRKELLAKPLKPAWAGVPMILMALALLIVGSLGAEVFLSRCSLIFLLAGIVLLLLGWECFKVLLFPLGMLAFMVPLPLLIFNKITLPLQFLASNLASVILSGLGVPVLQEGNIINLPATPLGVEEACSGIRSLLSLGTLSVIFAYFTETRMALRVLISLASVPIALGANVLRIVLTGLLVQYWDVDKAMGFFHEFSGWVIFMSSLALLFSLSKVIHFIQRRLGWAVAA